MPPLPDDHFHRTARLCRRFIPSRVISCRISQCTYHEAVDCNGYPKSLLCGSVGGRESLACQVRASFHIPWPSPWRAGLVWHLRTKWQHEVYFFPAVTCPGIEAQLSEHVTWRLVSGSLNEYGAQVVLSCSPGYYLEGRRLLQCHANGTWSAGEERPRCRGEWQVCPRPQALPHPWWQRHLPFNGLSTVILCISGVTKWHFFSLQWGMYIFIQHT